MKVYRCSAGHSWQAEPDFDSSGADRSAACRLCEGQADQTPPPPAELRSGGERQVQRTKGGTVARAIDRYELLSELGRGGMGVVYRAFDPRLGRVVALKVLLHAAHASASEVMRFRREAEAIAQLQHPNVIPVFEFGQADGSPFYTMEYVSGGRLDHHPAVRERDPRKVAELFRLLAGAMEAAHTRGIIHRDLKPANVLIGEDGQPKIGDFGLARRMEEQEGITVSGALLGTPGYMAPEQLQGEVASAGPAADVYAMGVMLYEALAGQRPGGDSRARSIAPIEDAAPPGRINRRVPRDLETICVKCLRHRPEDRYRDGGELAADLERYLRHEPILARRTGPAARMAKWIRRRPLKAIAVATILALMAVLIYTGWYLDAYVFKHVELFAQVTYRWGTPVGVGELNAEQRRHARMMFEITKYGRRNPASEVRIVNSFGHELPDAPFRTWFDGFSSQQPVLTWSRNTYEYSKEGRLMREKAFDPSGRMIYEMQFSYPEGERGSRSRFAVARYFREMGRDFADIHAPILIHLTRSADGLDRAVSFTDGRGTPQENLEGSLGYRIGYDGSGLISRIDSVDPAGNLRINRMGFATVRIERDDAGRERRDDLLDADGKAVQSTDGVAGLAMEYDASGNPQLMRFCDERGSGVRNRAIGAAQIRWEYDDAGQLSRERYFDERGRATVAAGGAAWMAMKHDELGRLVYLETHGANDELLSAEDRRYDDRGRLIESVIWEDSTRRKKIGREALFYRGEHLAVRRLYKGEKIVRETTYEHDDHGRPWRMTITDGGAPPRPVRLDDGYSRLERRYGTHGEVSEVRWSGYPEACGYAVRFDRYDSDGALEQSGWLDAQGAAATGPQGFSRELISRNTNGRIDGVRFLDAGGREVHCTVVAAGVSSRSGDDTGLREGDQLIRYDNARIASAIQFKEVRRLEAANYDHKALEIVRDGQAMTVNIGSAPLGVALEDRVLP